MFNHEYFRELSALSAIGQLSSREDQKLAEHLKECSNCRDAHLEYARIIQQQLPQADVIRWRIRSSVPAPRLDAEIRSRFLARARADGIDFSPEVETIECHGLFQFFSVLVGVGIMVGFSDRDRCRLCSFGRMGWPRL
jgi:predicted anti-sigma-YlaC factor YlaD